MKLLTKLLVVVFLLSARGLHAQQISPTALEFGHGKAKGFFTVQNTGIQPWRVQVIAKTLTFSSVGSASASLLLPNVAVHFHQPSFTLGPRAQHTVDFDAECITSTPCHFEVVVQFSPAQFHEGLSIGYELGGAVYLCERQRDCRKTTLAALNVPNHP